MYNSKAIYYPTSLSLRFCNLPFNSVSLLSFSVSATPVFGGFVNLLSLFLLFPFYHYSLPLFFLSLLIPSIPPVSLPPHTCLTNRPFPQVDLNKLMGIHFASSHPITDNTGTTYNLGCSFLAGPKYHMVRVPPAANNNLTGGCEGDGVGCVCLWVRGCVGQSRKSSCSSRLCSLSKNT